MNRGQQGGDGRGEPRRLLLAALGLSSVLGYGLLVAVAPGGGHPRGDEPTYQAMVESLIEDGDLRFDESDRRRRPDAAPAIILQRTPSGVAYSKPALYPVLAAPLVGLLGASGYLVLNLGVVVAALGLAWGLLRRSMSSSDSAISLLTFAAAGVTLFYAGWWMGDLLQFSLALAGLALSLGDERGLPGGRRWQDRLFEHRAAPWAGGVLLGLLTALRYTHGLIALAPVAALLLGRRRARAAWVLVAMLAGLGAASLLNRALVGTVNPYKAVRASFNDQTGYPAGQEGRDAEVEFEEQRKTYRMGLRPRIEPSLSAYSSLYFLVGRHTGLLFYFPAALWLALAALRRPDRVGVVLVAAAAGLAVFYLVWLPRNYFGGATFLGNRYFLAAYPALLVALRRPPSWWQLTPAWVIALLVAGSAAVSLERAAPLERSSQVHAYAGLFRRLPFESTTEALDGPRDRYWSDELVRFADPYARVEKWGFHLQAGDPAAELLVASPRDVGVLRFIVQADVPEVELVYTDWSRREVIRLGPAAGEGIARGVVEIVASPPWRRHPFPWREELTWKAWVFRLRLRSPTGVAASAELRFLGPYRLSPKFYAHQTVALELPERAAAGTTTRIAVEALNRGRRPWSSQAAVPVHLRYRLEPVDGSESLVGRVSRLSSEVEWRQLLRGSLTVRWPQEPGRYRLSVDLVLGGTVWFEQIGGSPLGRSEVEVTAG